MSQFPLITNVDEALRARPFNGIRNFAENMHHFMSTTNLAGLFNTPALYDNFILYCSHRIHRADQDPLNSTTSVDPSFIGQHHWLFEDLCRLSPANARWMCMWCIVMLQQKHFAWARADRASGVLTTELASVKKELAETLKELDQLRSGSEEGEL